MYLVYISNGPIGVEELYIQGRFNGDVRGYLSYQTSTSMTALSNRVRR